VLFALLQAVRPVQILQLAARASNQKFRALALYVLVPVATTMTVLMLTAKVTFIHFYNHILDLMEVKPTSTDYFIVKIFHKFLFSTLKLLLYYCCRA
jgi:hypothetical protein